MLCGSPTDAFIPPAPATSLKLPPGAAADGNDACRPTQAVPVPPFGDKPANLPILHGNSSPPSTKKRTAWQLSCAKPYVGIPGLSIQWAKEGLPSTTSARRAMSPLPASWSSAPSVAEAATAVPSRAPSPQPCIVCWGFFYSPIYPTPPCNMPVHGDTICPLVPGFRASAVEGRIFPGTTGKQAKKQPPAANTLPAHMIRELNPRAPVEPIFTRPSAQQQEASRRRVYALCDYTQWQKPSGSMGINQAHQNKTEGGSSSKSKDLTARHGPNESTSKVPALPGSFPAKAGAAACVPPFLLP